MRPLLVVLALLAACSDVPDRVVQPGDEHRDPDGPDRPPRPPRPDAAVPDAGAADAGAPDGTPDAAPGGAPDAAISPPPL